MLLRQLFSFEVKHQIKPFRDRAVIRICFHGVRHIVPPFPINDCIGALFPSLLTSLSSCFPPAEFYLSVLIEIFVLPGVYNESGRLQRIFTLLRFHGTSKRPRKVLILLRFHGTSKRPRKDLILL